MGISTRHWENIEVTITNTGQHKILLGTDWLKVHNPSIDWSTNQLCFDWCPLQCHPIEQQDPMIRQFLPIDTWETQNDDYLNYTDHGTDALQHIVAHKAHYFEPMIQKTMVSTTLAKGEERKATEIPPEFYKYMKVFLDEEAQQLPKHQPWDHKIDLQPGLQMRKTLVYRLMPPEMIALKEYIADSLKRGTLQRSEALDACSFFFIDKKDGKLCPVQDYRPLNAITRKNVAPILLILELINKLLGA